jgi:hypothetical protein
MQHRRHDQQLGDDLCFFWCAEGINVGIAVNGQYWFYMEAVKCCVPRYSGGPLKLFRSQLAHLHVKGIFGPSWTVDEYSRVCEQPIQLGLSPSWWLNFLKARI